MDLTQVARSCHYYLILSQLHLHCDALAFLASNPRGKSTAVLAYAPPGLVHSLVYTAAQLLVGPLWQLVNSTQNQGVIQGTMPQLIMVWPVWRELCSHSSSPLCHINDVSW